MNTPARHPAEAVLADYASGALRPAFGVVVAAHLEHCAHCRGTVRGLEALGGALLSDLEGTQMSDEALARVMAGLDRPLAPPPEPPRGTIDRVQFGKELWLGPGMGLRKGKVAGEDLLYMLRLPAGQHAISHGHEGREFTTVLKGAFDDGSGVLHAGDFAAADAEVEHLPHVTAHGECVCLIASEAPMKAQTWLGRMVQRVAGV